MSGLHKPAPPSGGKTTDRRRKAKSTKAFIETGKPPLWRRMMRRLGPSEPPRLHSNLPLLIKVFSAFTTIDEKLEEEEVDSILGFLRYDYPETVYSELRHLFIESLRERQDLGTMASQLALSLTQEDKILLGVQLYVLVSRAGADSNSLHRFFLFMTALGIAAEAKGIASQLNATEEINEEDQSDGKTTLESLTFGSAKTHSVRFDSIPPQQCLAAFRFRSLVLLKNVGETTIVARGRTLEPGEFCRLFEGQQVVLSDVVLTYQDLNFYFNARKDLSGTRIFLNFHKDNHVIVERRQSKQSALEIRFGLDVEITALRPTEATLDGQPLPPDEPLHSTLRGKILLPNDTQILLSDLRHRARELGGRFELVADRNEYMVSNNPNLLGPGDILLSPGVPGDILLRIRCDYVSKSGQLEVLKASRPVFVDGQPARFHSRLHDGDTITIGEGQFLRCHFSERIIEEERNIINRLAVNELTHAYSRHETALDSVSFEARRGEMLCVMGPSACGKSTLLRILAGQLPPQQGKVSLNDFDLAKHGDNLRPYISFMPHEDGFDSLLTVRENMETAAAIRAPHFSNEERSRRVTAKLTELGLRDRHQSLAGTYANKTLSHGERKRLNLGLDVIGISDVYLFDEPTSGLSSKDSEHVLEIIKGLAHNKIIIVSIHQPSARLFHMFDKALLLDHGGKMAFHGTPDEMLAYFREAHEEENLRLNAPGNSNRQGVLDQPDFIFDVLETPLLDPSGELIYEEDHRGQVKLARRFPPVFWRDRFQARRVMKELHQPVIREEEGDGDKNALPPATPSMGLAEEWTHLLTQAKRAFLSKLRNRANLATTLLEAPALAVLVALAMRYSEDGDYTFATAFHIPTYLFLTLVVGMFLGLTNSADEIVRDRAIIRRERNHYRRHTYYVAAKTGSLAFFSLVQCVIYLLIGNAILQIRDMLFWHLLWMLLATLSGVVIGLFISSLVRDAKTALNAIPLILVPQIILGGALIKYEEMNRDIDFIPSFTSWQAASDMPPSKLKVPFICEFMPLRWAYEGMVLSQATRNPVNHTISQVNAEMDVLKEVPHGQLSEDKEMRLETLKEALIPINFLAAPDPSTLRNQLRQLRQDLADNTFTPDEFMPPDGKPPDWITAQDIYVNSKTRNLFETAEVERLGTNYQLRQKAIADQDKLPATVNIFFGKQKAYFGTLWNTTTINLIVIALFLIAGFWACVLRVRRLANRA